MVTPSDTSAPAAPPPPGSGPGPGKKGGRRGGGKGGGGKGGGGKEGGKTLTIVAINRRVAALQNLESKDKQNKARRRLVHAVLAGIADGRVKQPNKAAEAVLTLMPTKGGKGGAAKEATEGTEATED